MANYDAKTYWAAETDSKCAVERTLKRVENYREWLVSSGRQDKMLRAWHAFYGDGTDGDKSTHRLLSGGQQGELVVTTANFFAVLVRQTARLISGQKTALKAVATNSDAAAISETVLAESLLDYYDRKVQLQEADGDAVLAGLILSSGWMVYSWQTSLGEEVGVNPDTGKVLREGDVAVRNYLPWDVAVDPRDPPAQRQWVAFRTPAKRHDLAVLYPEQAEAILKAHSDNARDMGYPWDDAQRNWRMDEKVTDEDNVYVWELRHIASPALPSGRLLRFVNADCVLYDSAAAQVEGGVVDAGYPYPELLAFEFCPERQVGRPGGHTSLFDTLGLQELHDLLLTTVASNVNVGGMLNIWSQSEPNISRLSTGFNVITSATKPEVLDLVKIPPELMALSEALRGYMQQITGVNDVAMGEATKGMPAQLAALLEAKAVQFHQQGQAAYYRMIESSRSGLLKMLSRFAQGQRVAQLVGKSGSWAMRQWTGEDIGGIERVIVEPVNAIMKTFAGRIGLADSLAEKFPMSRDEYLAVYTTGNLTQTLDAPKAHLGRLAKEKELLMQGVGLPPVDMQKSMMTGQPEFVDDGKATYIRPLLTDRHWVDIPEYLSLLESPESRQDVKVVQAVTDVVQEHLRLWREMPPDLLMVLGGPPPPGLMGPPSLDGGPAGGPPTSPGGGGGPAMSEMASTDKEPNIKPPNMPAPPKNPLTQEQPPPAA